MHTYNLESMRKSFPYYSILALLSTAATRQVGGQESQVAPQLHGFTRSRYCYFMTALLRLRECRF
jgi:hypothetical protein